MQKIRNMRNIYTKNAECAKYFVYWQKQSMSGSVFIQNLQKARSVMCTLNKTLDIYRGCVFSMEARPDEYIHIEFPNWRQKSHCCWLLDYLK